MACPVGRSNREPERSRIARHRRAGYREVKNPTPTGVAVFPQDFRSVRSFAERSNNIVHWTEMPRGGHFAASEEPDLLIADLRSFFSKLVAG